VDNKLKCTCENGKPAEGKACTKDGAHICADKGCNKGFKLNAEKKCMKENPVTAAVCNCKYGTPVEGEACLKNGAEMCAKCDEIEGVKFFELVDFKGEGAQKDAKQCKPISKKECTCAHGVPAVGDACDEDKKEVCASCHENEFYSLNKDEAKCELKCDEDKGLKMNDDKTKCVCEDDHFLVDGKCEKHPAKKLSLLAAYFKEANRALSTDVLKQIGMNVNELKRNFAMRAAFLNTLQNQVVRHVTGSRVLELNANDVKTVAERLQDFVQPSAAELARALDGQQGAQVRYGLIANGAAAKPHWPVSAANADNDFGRNAPEQFKGYNDEFARDKLFNGFEFTLRDEVAAVAGGAAGVAEDPAADAR